MTIQISIDETKITQFCQQWNIKELALFGSVLRNDFHPEKSDIDILVSFSDGVHNTIENLLDMEEELKQIFKQNVDLVERQSIEESQNYLRRRAVLNSAKIIYAAS